MGKLPNTVTFRGHTYQRVEAMQTYPVYVGTVYSESRQDYDNAYGEGVDVGPTSVMAQMVARDLNDLKKELEETERSLLIGLDRIPQDWNLRLFTDIKTQDLHEFEGQVREEWNNAEEILRDINLGKVVMLENAIDELFTGM